MKSNIFKQRCRWCKVCKGLYKAFNKLSIVNTGDDEIVNGAALSPDIDTVIYGLAGIEGEFGWE